MTRLLAVAASIGALFGSACKSERETADETIESGSSAPVGSAGGFSASLSAALETGSGDTAGSGGAAGSGEAAAASAGSGEGAGSGAEVGAAPGSAPGSASASAAPGSGSGSSSAVATTPPAAGSASAVAATPPAVTPPSAKVPVQLPAELAKIKLSLLPNWDRDVVAAGTLSLEMKIRGKSENALFTFQYGYEDPRAPTDREAYKKYLATAKILDVAHDRQRGAAWLIEGKDATGRGAFRVVVNYGGERLVCFGSLYKDSPLGDDRDEVIIQAKKICETIQL